MILIKQLFTVAFICILQVPVISAAEIAKDAESTMTVHKETDTKIVNVLPELILRPVGILSSAAGLGFYVASLPFAAVANMLEPHDALKFTYNTFLLTPFRFTFLRPIGTYNVSIE